MQSMTVADVQHNYAAIKKEVEDRYSPASSSLSLASCISVAPQSGPAAGIVTTAPTTSHCQQQQQQLLTTRMYLQTQSRNQSIHGNIVQSGEMADMTIGQSSTVGSSGGTSSNSGGVTSNNNTGGSYLLPCPLCDIPLEPRVFRQHLDRHYPRDSPVCPVLQCGRRFAHPNSVRNHMRLKHTIQWAKMKAMRSSGGPFSGIPDYKL